MSGPVWRVTTGEDLRCDECLRETTRVFTEGEVVDGEHHAQRQLCEQCYEKNIALIARAT
jgi:hypothetical protein